MHLTRWIPLLTPQCVGPRGHSGLIGMDLPQSLRAIGGARTTEGSCAHARNVYGNRSVHTTP
jgi:hypothetical protein